MKANGLFIRMSLWNADATVYIPRISISKVVCKGVFTEVTYVGGDGKEVGITVTEDDTWFKENL